MLRNTWVSISVIHTKQTRDVTMRLASPKKRHLGVSTALVHSNGWLVPFLLVLTHFFFALICLLPTSQTTYPRRPLAWSTKSYVRLSGMRIH